MVSGDKARNLGRQVLIAAVPSEIGVPGRGDDQKETLALFVIFWFLTWKTCSLLTPFMLFFLTKEQFPAGSLSEFGGCFPTSKAHPRGWKHRGILSYALRTTCGIGRHYWSAHLAHDLSRRRKKTVENCCLYLILFFKKYMHFRGGFRMHDPWDTQPSRGESSPPPSMKKGREAPVTPPPSGRFVWSGHAVHQHAAFQELLDLSVSQAKSWVS